MDPIVGSGKYTYKVNEDWAHPPEGLEVRACAVSVDSKDRVYCFNRNPEHPVAAVVGGAKVSTKLDVLKHLVAKVDPLIIGGGKSGAGG